MEKGGGSRLLQMQARFQQKQMQERELKIASLYEAAQARALDRVRHSPNGLSAKNNPDRSPPQATHQPGKVRQMFEERRTKAGIDKSYPLQPIHNTERTRKALPNGYTKVTTNKLTEKKVSHERKTHTTTHSTKKVHKIETIANGAGDLNHNHRTSLNTGKHSVHIASPPPALPADKDTVDTVNTVNTVDSGDTVDTVNTVDSGDTGDTGDTGDSLLEDVTFPEELAPAPTPRSPAPARTADKQNRPANRRSPPKATPVKSKLSSVTPARKAASDNTVTQVRSPRGVMQKPASSVAAAVRKQVEVSSSALSARSKPASPGSRGAEAGAGAGAGGGAPCAVCGRRFAPDRLDKHQEICRRAHAKKRKPFDALKHRLAGTEAEPFIGKLRKGAGAGAGGARALNSSWRQKHEEFISAIRAAKQVQAHLAAGGKLSDLPPPPPSENADYVGCPHCGRRFNQAAAERHIPKCKDFQFNKPKNATRRR